MPPSERECQQVAQLLGREPRGLEEVAVARHDGSPVVIRVASLVDNKPFPTTFWLVDPELNLRIDREEATGLIGRMQRQVDGDLQLREAMVADHLAHIRLRSGFIGIELKALIERLGYTDVLGSKGIGGIADFSRIRCLHTWYAAHLVEPNTIGRLLDAAWAATDEG